MKAKSAWKGGGWGTWHTGDGGACPQGCDGPRHSVARAMELNQEATDRRRASLKAAHERWLGAGRKPPA